MGKWFEIGQTLLRTVSDLHLRSGGDGPSFVENVNAWVYSPDGGAVIGDVDQLLAEAGIPLVIAIRKKDAPKA